MPWQEVVFWGEGGDHRGDEALELAGAHARSDTAILLAEEDGEGLVKVCDEVAGELLELDVEVVLGGVHGGRSWWLKGARCKVRPRTEVP